MSQIEVIVLRCDESYEVKTIERDYKAIGAEVGNGFVEVLPNKKPNYTAYINEEGQLHGLPRNPWSDFVRQQGFMVVAPIVGPIVLCQATKKGKDCDVGEALKLAVRAHHQHQFKRRPAETEEANEARAAVLVPVVRSSSSESESSSESDDSDSDYRDESNEDEEESDEDEEASELQ